MHIHATVTIHTSQERTSKSYGIDRRMNILIANDLARTIECKKGLFIFGDR